jgi:hypothetical protein
LRWLIGHGESARNGFAGGSSTQPEFSPAVKSDASAATGTSTAGTSAARTLAAETIDIEKTKHRTDGIALLKVM